jgi:hypothetical protein
MNPEEGNFCRGEPRAVPWAMIFRPFGPLAIDAGLKPSLREWS